jgi:acetyl-CoA carboxylase carboxyl transferase subunit alpha
MTGEELILHRYEKFKSIGQVSFTNELLGVK